MPQPTILVTGGHGMVGRYLQKKAHFFPDYQWVFLKHQDTDLTDPVAVEQCFTLHRPTYVIHLAANVGGLYKHLSEKVEMFRSNLLMNTYVVDACHRHGVQKGIFCLSTCIFPQDTGLPMNESMLMDGPPHPSNDNYAYTKRMLYQHCTNYNTQYGREYLCLSPVNLFGKYDNFNLHDSHVIPAIIHKMYLSRSTGETLRLPGTGSALRQFLYAGDFARMILKCLFYVKIPHQMLICAGNTEISINDLATTLAGKMYHVDPIEYDSSYSDGLLRKTASNAAFMSCFPDFTCSDFDHKLDLVIRWFCFNYESLRK